VKPTAFVALLTFILAGWLTPATSAGTVDNEIRVLDLIGPGTGVPDLLDPSGKSRWYLDEVATGAARVRTFTTEGDTITVEDRWSEDRSTTVLFRDPSGGDAATLWAFPERHGDILQMGARRTLHLDRTVGDRTEHLRIYVRTVGIGWVHLPSGPLEVALQEALVLSAPEGSRSFSAESFLHRWVDTGTGVVAEVSGPAAPDGRDRLGATSGFVVENTIAAAADLQIYVDEIIRPVGQAVLYGLESRFCQNNPTVPCHRSDDCPSGDTCPFTPISTLTPQGYANMADLLAADTWDFSGRTTGTWRVSTTVDLNANETCNAASCGYNLPNVDLGREDINADPANLQYLISNNNVIERDDTGPVVIWLRAGAQKEGTEGLFGTGESRYCYTGNDGNKDRTPVPLWEFPHQDANGWYLRGETSPGAGDGDAWSSGVFDCEQNLYNQVCSEPGVFLDEIWIRACGDHAGTQSGKVLKGGVTVLPSGHTVNTLVSRTLTDFCIYLSSICLFDTDRVRAFVYLWSAPHLGTVALLQSEQNADPDIGLMTVLDESSITFGLFPPVTIGIDAVTDTTIDLSWNPGNITDHIDGYKVYWDTDSGSGSTYAFNSDTHPGQVSIVGTSATISGLTPGTTYFVTVTTLSDFASPSSGVVTSYESILFPTQVSGDPDHIYPVEVTADTAGGCTLEEISGLTAAKVATDVEFCWSQHVDPCIDGYDVLGSDTPADPASFVTVGSTTGVESTCWTGSPTETYFLVVARSAGAQGPKGQGRD
jgi:hypothetical protein